MKNILAVIPDDLHFKMKDKCSQEHINITTAVERALRMWIVVGVKDDERNISDPEQSK